MRNLLTVRVIAAEVFPHLAPALPSPGACPARRQRNRPQDTQNPAHDTVCSCGSWVSIALRTTRTTRQAGRGCIIGFQHGRHESVNCDAPARSARPPISGGRVVANGPGFPPFGPFRWRWMTRSSHRPAHRHLPLRHARAWRRARRGGSLRLRRRRTRHGRRKAGHRFRHAFWRTRFTRSGRQRVGLPPSDPVREAGARS